MNKRPYFLYLGLFISVLLNIAGLASIVDGIVSWVGFFKVAIEQYVFYVRDPLAYLVNFFWPDFFYTIPNIVFDLIIVLSSIVLSLNIFHYFEFGMTLFQVIIRYSKQIVSNHKWKITIFKFSFHVLFFYPAYLLIIFLVKVSPTILMKSVSIRFKSILMGLIFHARNIGYSISLEESALFVKYLLSVYGLLVVMLFINWQIKELQT